MENIQSLKAVIFNQAAHSLGSNTPQLKYPSVTADSTSPQLLYPLKTSETLTAGCQSGPRWRWRSPSELSESRRDFRPSPTSASGPAGCSVGNETRGRGGEQDEMTHYTTGWCVCVCEEASSSPPPPRTRRACRYCQEGYFCSLLMRSWSNPPGGSNLEHHH